MTTQPTAAGTWDEDPDGASIVLATGRARHDLLIVADPIYLTKIDAAWGRPASSIRLSFLPGVSAPSGPGQEDELMSFDRDGLGVLIARGRTSLFEGAPADRTTAFARIAAGAGIRAALLVTRADSVGGAEPGDVLVVGDHLNLSGSPLLSLPVAGPLGIGWDQRLAERLSVVEGVKSSAVAAFLPVPMRPTPAETRMLALLGADVVIADGVSEAMVLASRGVHVVGLACIDAVAGQPERPGAPGRRSTGRRSIAQVVHDVVEHLLDALH